VIHVWEDSLILCLFLVHLFPLFLFSHLLIEICSHNPFPSQINFSSSPSESNKFQVNAHPIYICIFYNLFSFLSLHCTPLILLFYVFASYLHIYCERNSTRMIVSVSLSIFVYMLLHRNEQLITKIGHIIYLLSIYCQFLFICFLTEMSN